MGGSIDSPNVFYLHGDSLLDLSGDTTTFRGTGVLMPLVLVNAIHYQDSTVPANHIGYKSIQWDGRVRKCKLRSQIWPNADHQKPAMEAVTGRIRTYRIVEMFRFRE